MKIVTTSLHFLIPRLKFEYINAQLSIVSQLNLKRFATLYSLFLFWDAYFGSRQRAPSPQHVPHLGRLLRQPTCTLDLASTRPTLGTLALAADVHLRLNTSHTWDACFSSRRAPSTSPQPVPHLGRLLRQPTCTFASTRHTLGTLASAADVHPRLNTSHTWDACFGSRRAPSISPQHVPHLGRLLRQPTCTLASTRPTLGTLASATDVHPRLNTSHTWDACFGSRRAPSISPQHVPHLVNFRFCHEGNQGSTLQIIIFTKTKTARSKNLRSKFKPQQVL